jgi:hypothetical protein
MSMSLNCLVWNVRGLNARTRRNVVREFMIQEKASLVCIQETTLAGVLLPAAPPAWSLCSSCCTYLGFMSLLTLVRLAWGCCSHSDGRFRRMLCRQGVSGGCFATEVAFPADALPLRSLTFPADALPPGCSGGCFAAVVVGISGRCCNRTAQLYEIK